MDRRAKAKAAEYQREWRKNNKDKVKRYRENYWNKKSRESRESEAVSKDAS